MVDSQWYWWQIGNGYRQCNQSNDQLDRMMMAWLVVECCPETLTLVEDCTELNWTLFPIRLIELLNREKVVKQKYVQSTYLSTPTRDHCSSPEES